MICVCDILRIQAHPLPGFKFHLDHLPVLQKPVPELSAEAACGPQHAQQPVPPCRQTPSTRNLNLRFISLTSERRAENSRV